jgi:hypothetical protein
MCCKDCGTLLAEVKVSSNTFDTGARRTSFSSLRFAPVLSASRRQHQPARRVSTPWPSRCATCLRLSLRQTKLLGAVWCSDGQNQLRSARATGVNCCSGTDELSWQLTERGRAYVVSAGDCCMGGFAI